MNKTIDQETNFITINNLALQYELPKNTPINSRKCSSYLEWIEKIDILPFNKATIRFSDNKWYFSDYSSVNINKSRLTLSFISCPNNYKRLLKQYALVKLIENKIKIQSLNQSVLSLGHFFSFLVNKTIMRLEDVTVTNIDDYITELNQNKGLSLSYIHKNRQQK